MESLSICQRGHASAFSAKLLGLSQAVIFIFEHSEQGSAGLILNRPTQYTIGGMPGLETLCPEFGENVLFLVRSQSAQDTSLVSPLL